MSWKMVRLGELFSIVGGGTPERSNSKFWDGNIPWVTVKDFISKRIERTQESISELGVKSSATNIIKKGSIIVPTRMALGKISICNIDVAINQDIKALIIKDQKLIDTNYFCYFYQSQADNIEKQGKGATVKGITLDVLKDLQIPLPPLAIQKRIAEILDTADTLRRKDQELLKKYDELAQAIFIDMFGDPVKNEKGWDVKRLKEISIKIHSGNTPKGGSNVYVKKGITFFRSQNVWKNNLVYDDIAFIDEKTHLSMLKSSLKYKDILMTKTGRINTENSSLGRAALFLGDDDSANVNGHVYLIRLQKKQIHEFVVHILTTKEYRGLIRDVCVGGIDKRQLNKDHIEEFPIINPPLINQQNFAKIISTIQTQKCNAEISASKSESIFNSLIQKAFKGELVK